MTYKETLSQLSRFLKTFKTWMIWMTALEVLLVIVIGVASNNLNDTLTSKTYTVFLIISGVVYFSILAIRTYYNKEFPISIVEELKAKNELNAIKKDLKRTTKVNNIIAQTIDSFTDFQTYVSELRQSYENSKDNHNDVNDLTISKIYDSSTKRILKNFTNNLDIIFNRDYSNYTVVLYLKNNGDDEGENPFPEILIIRDDFELNKDIPTNFMKDTNSKSWLFELQAFINSSVNDWSFEKRVFEKASNFKLGLCLPVKCQQSFFEREGALVILTEDSETHLPKDIESILNVFGRLIINWIGLSTPVLITEAIRGFFANLGKSISIKKDAGLSINNNSQS